MPHPICIYVHKIELQFYVFFVHLSLMWLVTFLPISPLVRVVQNSHRWVCLVPADYRGSHGYFLAQSLLLLNGCLGKANANGVPKGAVCLAWFRTLSVCTLPP
jgi:hypothetical protein